MIQQTPGNPPAGVDQFITVGVSREVFPALLAVLGDFALAHSPVQLGISNSADDFAKLETASPSSGITYNPRLVTMTVIEGVDMPQPVVTFDNIRAYARGESGVETPDWVTESLGTRVITALYRHPDVTGLAHKSGEFASLRQTIGVRADQYDATLLDITTRYPRIRNMGERCVGLLTELGKNLLVADRPEAADN